MVNHSDWSFKEPNNRKRQEMKEVRKFRKKEKRLAKKKKKNDFYYSEQWRKLRYRVLLKYSATCMCCGRNRKKHGVVIHVDHIKPRSKFPNLELTFENLQILCEDCNLGKSNIDTTDWRPRLTIDENLDLECLANSPL